MASRTKKIIRRKNLSLETIHRERQEEKLRSKNFEQNRHIKYLRTKYGWPYKAKS